MLTQFRRICILSLALLLAKSQVFSQVDPQLENLRTVVPPSPNASSLGKYGEWPVSLHTGVPNIDIPIYTIKGRSLALPISLSYHAAGIRVSEVASWVGLGWSLNAGGVITRSVRGLPDEDAYFGIAANSPDPNNLCNTSDSIKANAMNVSLVNGTGDVQMDDYTFSGMGKSFSLMVLYNGIAYTRPYSNIKITAPNYNNQGFWRVVLEDGTTLIYGGSAGYYETTTNIRFSSWGPFVSSWYLKSITSPVGENVLFTYSNQAQVQMDGHVSQSDFIQYKTNGIDPLGVGVTCYRINESLNVSTHPDLQQVDQLLLSGIETDLCKVNFIAGSGTRSDLKGGINLSEIKVYSKPNNLLIDDYKLNYSYSAAAGGFSYKSDLPVTDTSYLSARLKLMTLQHFGGSVNSSPETWTFGYNQNALPSRRSYAVDHWGFYNGVTGNTSFLPGAYFQLPLPSVNNYYDTIDASKVGFMASLNSPHPMANKEPSENYMQAEILNSIIYPTGGATKFTYEGNGYLSAKEVFGDTSVPLAVFATANQSNFQPTATYNFTITKPEYVELTFSSSISQQFYNDFKVVSRKATITSPSGKTVASIDSAGHYWFNLLAAGTYQFKIFSSLTSQSDFPTSAYSLLMNGALHFFPSKGIQTVKTLTGGLRIKSILSIDSIANKTISKYYTYDSAFVVSPVNPDQDYFTSQTSTAWDNQGAFCTMVKVTRNTSTKNSFGNVAGGTTAYGIVKVYEDSLGLKGYKIAHFLNQKDSGIIATSIFPYPPTDSRDWRRGVLLDESVLNSAGVLLKKASNYYQFPMKYSVTNFVWGQAFTDSKWSCTIPSYTCGFLTRCFQKSTEQVNLIQTTTVTYDQNGANPSTVVNTNYYDNSISTLPTRVITTDSKGNALEKDQYTALDKATVNTNYALPVSASQAIDSMVARNMISSVIQQIAKRGGVQLTMATTNYKIWGKLILPSNVVVQKGSNTAESRVQFNSYDTLGNLLEQQKISDVIHSYKYDYSGNLPISDAVNSTDVNTAYTSFEADGKGGWTYSGISVPDTTAITGYRVYSVADGAITRSGLISTGAYTVSYWTKNASAFTITGTVAGYPIAGRQANGWTYFEHKITGVTSVTISGTGFIDELRLYEARGTMATVTYDGLRGQNSQADINNHTTYYTYDDFNRLALVRDQDRNLVKKIAYSYAGQTGVGNVYFNVAYTNSYQRTCTGGQTGSFVSYTVPANLYSSSSSQADADARAQADANIFGPLVANAKGTCTSAPVSITATNNTALTGFSVSYTNTSTLAVTTFTVPAAGGTLGTLTPGTYNVSISKAGNTTTKYLYTICSQALASAVVGNLNNVAISSTCSSITIDTVQ